MESHTADELIVYYFSLGLTQIEISAFLCKEHGIDISNATLKRKLKSNGLYRRKHFSGVDDVSNYIRGEICKSGKLHGYKWMHLKCLQEGFTVKRETVREVLKELDPQGVEIRRRRRLRRRLYCNNGPNYLWHLDSYDKLKPYGININGCIDGFSRYIIWLRAGLTSSDPKVTKFLLNILFLLIFTHRIRFG